MGIYHLDYLFNATYIADVGASEKTGTIGHAVMQNLLKSGYEGRLFPINPHYSNVFSIPAYHSLKDLEGPIDLAVVAIPLTHVPELIKQCIKVEVKGLVVISAGGKEIGSKGREIEEEIRQEAKKGGIRIMGPNCLGFFCAGSKINASFALDSILPGNMAFISQSGAICTAIADLSVQEQMGFSHYVSIGSMLDIDFGDLIDYLGNDPRVKSIILYVESLTNFRKFMSAARAVSRVKPIVVLKAGKSAAGARAAASHTGAMAGEDAVYTAAFRRAGILRVDTIEELFDCAELLAKQPRPLGPRLAIITNAGGPGVMAADALSSYGIEPHALGPDTKQKLDEFLPPFWSRNNPIDILGDASPQRYRQALDVCVSSSDFDAILIMMVPQALTDAAAVAAELTKTLGDRRHLLLTVCMGGASMVKAREIYNKAGIPTFETPERAVRAFMHMVSYTRNLEMLQEIPPSLPRSLTFDVSKGNRVVHAALDRPNHLLTETESKTLLAAYGIPVNPTKEAASEDEAVQLAETLGYPLVMKVNSRDITHKSDAHGVILNLKNTEDIRSAYRAIMSAAHDYNPKAELLGVTLQPMLQRIEHELLVGGIRDKDFGPVILFGSGGTLTEILRDRSLALPPLNRLLARRLIEDTRAYVFLKGYRNRPPANLDLLEEVLIRVSQLVTDLPEVAELDINPLVVSGDRMYAVDARVVVKSSDVSSPYHMVISPYPNEYETYWHMKDGTEVFIRPIKPEDAPLLEKLFSSLSPKSIYFRFFSPLKHLPKDMLARFTQIDYDRDMAFVASHTLGGEERFLGVGRLMSLPDFTTAEFAIVVGDPWQGKGLGAQLLSLVISIAAKRGIKKLGGRVLAENTTMLSLCHKTGFTVNRIPDTGEYEVEKRLS
ncbi:MAG: bifunctional acetate--CoA ligase family protein/GNAT family N-acetyltransferase [Deltaproteobacteria bacterium]|nr:bifunctional acetate--CoA ligase family protein/GNAT family N-acetyltransferase [Deltaproteobacteria bacterium]